MKHSSSPSGRTRSAFTLIELLVVVAIIALLISILLPSLAKARAQARTTLCASRISQITKGMYMYSSDFDETPPFVNKAQCDWNECLPGSSKMDESGENTTYFWAENETWLMPHMPELWAANAGGVFGMGNDESYARNELHKGTLFPYARFDALYRCPEFERKPANGGQRIFNYTRSWAGRRILTSLLGDKDDFNGSPADLIRAGKIMKMSQVYAPSALWMVIDEQYNSHCGADPSGFRPPDESSGGILGSIGGMPMCADSVHTIVGDEIGQYHGAKGREIKTAFAESQIPAVEQGSVSFFDGHVALARDPLPGRKVEGGELSGLTTEIGVVVDMVRSIVYGQRGMDASVDVSALGG
jgi:prepilin-type N-terminal cleavage/methylation domain-containing protein